jgi:16S rRNA (guanine527-N7)-methyltransferase
LWRVPQWFPDLADPIQAKLKEFHVELLKFNLKLNLISRTTERDADEVHFADSIFGSRMVLAASSDKSFVDIGSGNGLPGIVLAILAPEREFNLVESDGRKAEFLKHVIHKLGIKNTQVASVRFENMKILGGTAGISRGFASISKTLLLSNRVFTKGSNFYHFKGSNWAREVAEIPAQLMSFWTPELVGEYSLPVGQARRGIVVTKKVG